MRNFKKMNLGSGVSRNMKRLVVLIVVFGFTIVNATTLPNPVLSGSVKYDVSNNAYADLLFNFPGIPTEDMTPWGFQCDVNGAVLFSSGESHCSDWDYVPLSGYPIGINQVKNFQVTAKACCGNIGGGIAESNILSLTSLSQVRVYPGIGEPIMGAPGYSAFYGGFDLTVSLNGPTGSQTVTFPVFSSPKILYQLPSGNYTLNYISGAPVGYKFYKIQGFIVSNGGGSGFFTSSPPQTSAQITIPLPGLGTESYGAFGVYFVPLPTVDLKVNSSDGPISILSGSSATLSWTSTNADTCAASGGWTGSKATSGSESTGVLTTTKTYTITCTGPGGTASDSVTVNVVPPGDITVNATFNGSPWTGPINYTLSGPESISGTSVATTFTNKPAGSYTLTYGSGGPAGAIQAASFYTPTQTQTLPGNSTIIYTMNFMPGPLVVSSCFASPNPQQINTNVTWYVSTPSGGTGTYTYSWLIDGTTYTTPSVTKSYPTIGTKTASVTVVSGSESKTVACTNLTVNDDKQLTLTKNLFTAGTVKSVYAGITGINCGTGCLSQNKLYANGTTPVSLTATAAGGYTFSSWTGDADCSDGSVTMNADKTCTATFNLTTYTLTVNSSGASGVAITSTTGDAGTTNYAKTSLPAGSSRALTAPLTSGAFTFSSWTGCTSVSGTTCNRTMDANRTVTANYVATTHTLTVAPSPTGGRISSGIDGFISCGNGASTCSHVYSSGASVTLTALPAIGYTYGNWQGDCGGGSNAVACSGPINTDISVSATFIADGGGGGSPGIDLTASEPTPGAAIVGVAKIFSSTITNGGDTATGAGFTNRFQVSTSPLGTNPTNYDILTPSSLAAGANVVTSQAITFSTPGIHYIRVCADYSDTSVNGVIAESNEGNNCSNSPSWTQVTVSLACAANQGDSCSVSNSCNSLTNLGTFACDGVTCSATPPSEASCVDGSVGCGATSFACTGGATASNEENYYLLRKWQCGSIQCEARKKGGVWVVREG